jgi:hypothetical protein
VSRLSIFLCDNRDASVWTSARETGPPPLNDMILSNLMYTMHFFFKPTV